MIGKIPLPYQDTKPQGAADFYFINNATFRFIKQRLGMVGLQCYWRDLGAEYFRPVADIWKAGGLDGVASYWKAFFEAEPGGVAEVRREEARVVLEIRECPAIKHLRLHSREIVPEFCQHCHYVSNAIGAMAGISARICGGNGACVQEFRPAEAHAEDLSQIALCS